MLAFKSKVKKEGTFDGQWYLELGVRINFFPQTYPDTDSEKLHSGHTKYKYRHV